ncbi:ABC transporter ATP-binding protein [Microbulbifer flavimaris]|uniref:ABC transporter ATP-binding protein n=1 Tax=Microbulbifer flavimaris TaxID=1781068 RepID=A0ABX4HYV1_9GAMM|nr:MULTISPECIES: sn-glycerol-3-phosphate ABC transporter ATP-binding protein UgpC [Microbulbifer]KUJ82974.1 ABC transporter ATP-binding protein [Microbulbifer sp. ZGT114]PCO05158.1 ABC transporter ATP-binding protein [Microbulbifer flavimaris]
MAELQLQSVKKRFGSTQTIHGVDLQIQPGEFVVFVGPSGCGKSTLLRMIAGLETVTEGSIHIARRDVTALAPSQRRVSMVFQSYALYPHMTAEQNLSFGMRMRKVAKETVAEKVERASEILQLEPYLKRKPGELSGGQCQRVAIGRALVQDPDVFLFDEPLSNLDAELRVKMRAEIADLHQRLGATMIYVTHDQTEAMTLANRIVVLRDGRVEQVGEPMALYTNPANQFVAGFIGSPKMNFLPVVSTGVDGEKIEVAVEGEGGKAELSISCNAQPAGGDELTLGIRPEHTTIDDSSELRARVRSVEQLGSISFLYCTLGGKSLCVQSQGQLLPRPGYEVGLRFAADKLYLFDANEQTISTLKPMAEH